MKDYGRFDYEIYAFDKPMAPGETRTMAVPHAASNKKGFKNSGNTHPIVDNGTFVNNNGNSCR